MLDKTTSAPLTLGETDTPLGRVVIACDDAGLVALSLPSQDPDAFLQWLDHRRFIMSSASSPSERHVEVTIQNLAGYFAGTTRAFTVSLAPRGTAFQQQVWQAVFDVPFGETRTYGAVAAAIGRPQAPRAVGHANGANPIPIIVACHRLIGSTGALTGYGGGLEMKRWLIEHERTVTAGEPPPA